MQKGRPVLQAGYSYFGTPENDQYYGVFGVVGVSGKLELSGGINRYRTDFNAWQRSDFAVGAKYQLLSNRAKGLNVAVGAGIYSDATSVYDVGAAPRVVTIGHGRENVHGYEVTRLSVIGNVHATLLQFMQMEAW